MFKISEVEQQTYKEIQEKFIECGFTKEDFEKTKEIEEDKTVLWICASVAKHFGVKPYELLASIFVGSIASHLNFGILHNDIVKNIESNKKVCEFCENKKNLFLTRECFDAEKDSSEMIIKYPESGNVIVASEDSYSIYKRPTRTVRRITINYCPICGKKLNKLGTTISPNCGTI